MESRIFRVYKVWLARHRIKGNYGILRPPLAHLFVFMNISPYEKPHVIRNSMVIPSSFL